MHNGLHTMLHQDLHRLLSNSGTDYLPMQHVSIGVFDDQRAIAKDHGNGDAQFLRDGGSVDVAPRRRQRNDNALLLSCLNGCAGTWRNVFLRIEQGAIDIYRQEPNVLRGYIRYFHKTKFLMKNCNGW